MGDFSFSGLPNDTHHCTSHREGDWIIWRCPHCSGYERRLNYRTGEMKIQRGGSDARHTGVNDRLQNMEALARVQYLN